MSAFLMLCAALGYCSVG